MEGFDQEGFKLVLNCVLDFAVKTCVPGDKLEVDVEWSSEHDFKPIYLTWTMKEEAKAEEAPAKKEEEEDLAMEAREEEEDEAEKGRKRVRKEAPGGKEEEEEKEVEIPAERRLCYNRMVQFCESMKSDFLMTVVIAQGYCQVLIIFHSPHAKKNREDEEKEQEKEGEEEEGGTAAGQCLEEEEEVLKGDI
jgi:hypothetical protein